MNTILFFAFQLAVLLFSVVIHEISHGYTALRLGDETAKRAGRLTLNPIKHLDPIGSFLVPAFLALTGSGVIIGWAKPVPYNPALLIKDYKFGPLKVALAGPGSNLLIAAVISMIIRFGSDFLPGAALGALGFIVYLNIVLGIFNLMPIPPLDGSKILTFLLPRKASFALERMGLMGMVLVIFFLFFFSGFISAISGWIFGFLVGENGTTNFLELLG